MKICTLGRVHIAAFDTTELFSWEKSGKHRNESQYELSLFVAVDLFMHVSKLSEFIQSDVPSNTLLLIPNEFGTVFERLERLEELEIQYSQPEQLASHSLCVSLLLQSAL